MINLIREKYLTYLLVIVFTGTAGTAMSNLRNDNLPSVLTLDSKEKPTTYEYQWKFGSTYIILNSDSTFIYYSVFEVGYDLTLGTFKKKKNTLILNWDENITLEAISDKDIYGKYFEHSKPNAFQIERVHFKIKNKTLVRQNRLRSVTKRIRNGF